MDGQIDGQRGLYELKEGWIIIDLLDEIFDQWKGYRKDAMPYLCRPR